MATLDRTDEFLARALQEDRAAQRATSIEARLSHQKLAMHLRRAVARFGFLRRDGDRDPR
ncbi:hypothetical protein [uncultured Sphingomonas sp.]|uniref:hypothetical protein n=1 Tax=uncultured Sphingomonas sp. TaxID=158754 RepID=UPI0035CB5A82